MVDLGLDTQTLLNDIVVETRGEPRLSVLMTVYNGLPYVRSAVESILNQTFADFEFVIVDDGSTDETLAYLQALDDPRVRVIARENGGTAAAANEGLSYCTGELLARMDADDEAIPTRFERQVDYLDQNAEIGLVGSYTWALGECRTGGVTPLPTDHEEIVDALMAGRHALSHPTLMMRTDLLEEIGGYWSYRLIDDWDMMLRMSETTLLANIPEPLLRYRVHRGSLNGESMAKMRFSIDFARARSRSRREGSLEPELAGFEQGQASQGSLQRIASGALCYSLMNYRIAVAERNGPRPWMMVPHLMLAGLSRPDLVFLRVVRHLPHSWRRPKPSNSSVVKQLSSVVSQFR